MAAEAFTQIGLILLVVFLISIVFRILKQPLIIGYIVAGIIVSILGLLNESNTLLVFSEMGVAFLLFIVGIGLSPKMVREVGKISIITGIGQIIFTSLIGYLIATALGFDWITAAYIAIALTFSSTIIIMKLLSDKDALEKLYGKISIGFLLVQDIVAIIILILISSLESGTGGASSTLISILIKGGLSLAILIPFSYYILPKLEDFFAKSQEFLFIFALSWGFGLSLLFVWIGLSIEVGALMAGILLSMSPYSYEISSKLKPLRDFFLISFFIILGSQMAFGNITPLILPAVIFSAFILIGNPLIVMGLMGLFGYSRKTGFMAGLTVAQISEFSLILIALGVKNGSLSQDILSFVTIIGLITIAGSTYMILYSDQIYKRINRILKIFERKNLKESEKVKKEHEYILLGYNRIGFSIVKSFSKITKSFLVVDFDPKVVKRLKREKINAIYGDVENSDFLEDIKIQNSSVVVSTVPEKETNQLILETLKKNNSKAISIVTARQIKEAFELYDLGADYVILPHFLGGEYTSKLIEQSKKDKKKYSSERNKEIKLLKERIKEGHMHPNTERNRK